MKEALIMDIQRFSIHDGPGIRTTVFFKGCHMSCKWCHNPESWNRDAEMLFYQERCIQCMSCKDFCTKGAHSLKDGKHQINLETCRNCTRMEECAGRCPAEAMRICGRRMSSGEVLEKVLADRIFYGDEGGVTCSGGEALLQDEFLFEFFTMCRENGLSTCLDTTLNVEWERVERLLPLTDLFLVDIKFMDEEKHRHYTGRDGRLTIQNLRNLSELKKPVILRMPLLAGINDTVWEAEERGKLLKELTNVQRVDFFAVTGHGAAKYRALQKEFIPFNRNQEPAKLTDEMERKIAAICERKGQI